MIKQQNIADTVFFSMWLFQKEVTGYERVDNTV